MLTEGTITSAAAAVAVQALHFWLTGNLPEADRLAGEQALAALEECDRIVIEPEQ